MSAPSVLAAVFALIALIGLALASGNARPGRVPESTQVALEAVRKTALRQLLASWKLQGTTFLLVACLAAFGGLTRGNGWFLPFAVVPAAGALAVLTTWFGGCAMLREAGGQLVDARTKIAGNLARTTLGATLLAQALGASLGLGMGALEGGYGLRLGDWATVGIALSAFFVALAAATLEPLTLGRAGGREPSPADLGAAAALALVRPMRSLIVLVGLNAIAFDRLTRTLGSSDPGQGETSTYLLLVLGGSALATLFGGLSVRSDEQEEVALAFRRGTRSSLAILAACIWLARGQGESSFRSHTQLWTLGLFAFGALAFFFHAFGRARTAPPRISPARTLGLAMRAPLLVGIGFLVTRTFEPNLSVASILFVIVTSAAPIALLSTVSTDCRRGANHLAWLVLHPNAVRAALEDSSLERLPPVELWLFGACLLSMDGPVLDLERMPASIASAMVLVGVLVISFALAVHRHALEEPIRESRRIVDAEAGEALPLTRPVELGEKAVNRAGLPLVVFLIIGATLTFVAKSALIPTTLSSPITAGIWLGALTLGVGAAGYLSDEPLSIRGSLGPLALTLTLTLGTLLSSVQSIVL